MKKNSLLKTIFAINFPWHNLFSLILVFSIGLANVNAQITVSGSTGADGTYTSFTQAAGAFSALNANAQTGNTITISITSDVTTEDGTNSLNSGGWTSLTISPSGARTISGAVAGVLINLNGADNVNINGLNTGGNSLTIENTTTGASSSTIRFIADASSNTIQNCTIKGSTTSVTLGTIFFSTGTTTGNDGNTISGCTITSSGANLPTNAIYGSGTASPADNSGNIITGNNIQDFFNSALFSCGVLINAGNTDWTISGNSFFQSATRTFTVVVATFSHACININTTAGNNFNVSGNYLGGTAATCGGTAYTVNGTFASRMRAISLTVGSVTATSVQGNTIANFSWSTTSTAATLPGTWIGIYVTAGAANIGTSSPNTIGSGTGTGSISLTALTGGSGATAIGIGSLSSGTINISNNIIGSITSSGSSTAISAGIIGIGSSGGGVVTISGNTIGSTSTSNSLSCPVISTNASAQQLKGIEVSGATSVSITNNTIANGTNAYAGTGTTSITCGILSTTASTITGNIIYSVTTTSAGVGTGTSSTIYGIGVAALTTPGHTISQNTIRNLSNTNTTAATSVLGIHFAGGNAAASTSTISRNLIHSISNASSSATALLYGINATGHATYSNNMIRLGIDGGTSITNGLSIRGINESSTSGSGATTNYYFNSVYIGGTGVAGSNNTFAFSSSSTTITRDFRDNIFVNARSNGAGTGKHYAITVGGTAANPAGLTINYNDYYAPGTGGVLGLFNAVDQPSVLAWQTAVGQDGNSLNSDPQFIAPTGASPSAVDLHIDPSIATAVESSGLAIGSVTDDYDGQARSGLTPTDIGADAGNFTGLDLSGPSITYTVLANDCNTGNRTLSVTIIDATGVPTSGILQPRIYYRKPAGSWFSQQGSLAAGSATNGTWNFTIVAADMGGLAFTDVVNYYVIAQDIVGPYISSSPSGVVATDVNTVTTPPTVNSYTIYTALNGSYNVGTGGAFLTLTAAIGVYNSTSCLTGPVTFLLTDASYAETFPIIINQHSQANATNTLTIKPATTTTISGSSTTGIFKLNGADYIIFDGSNGSTTNSPCPTAVSASRDLTITNTNNATNCCVIWLSSLGAGAGSTNNIIKNCNLSTGLDPTASGNTTFGIVASGATIGTSVDGNDNNNNLFENNSITKARYGINLRGATGNLNSGNIIRQNLIGPSSFGTNNIAKSGVVLQYQNNANVSFNEIRNIGVNFSGTATFADRFGIALGSDAWPVATITGVTNTVVEKNVIHDIIDEKTGTTIAISEGTNSSPSNNIIANNMIYNIRGNSTTTDQCLGIGIAGGNGDKIVYNSILLTGDLDPGSSTTSTHNAAGIRITTATPTNLTLANNLIRVDVNSNTSTLKHYAIITPAGYVWGTGFCDHNDYSVNGSNAQMVFGGTGLATPYTDVPDLTTWKTLFTPAQDAASQVVNPVFVSSTDLHLVPNNFTNSTLDNGAITISGVTDDIDCQIRLTDIGADEFTYVPCIVAVLSGGGTICAGQTASITFTLSGTPPWSVTYFDGTNSFTESGITSSPHSVNVSPSTTVTYSLTTVSDAGCTAQTSDLSGSALVTVYDVPIVSISGNNTYCPSTPTLLTANATAGSGTISTYAWSLNGTSIGTNTDNYTASAPGNYAVTVTNSNNCTATSSNYAVSSATYTIAASVSGGGNISPSGNVIVNCEDNQAFNISGDACHVLDSVVVDGVDQGAISLYTFTSVTAGHTIDAYFHVLTYTINATATAGGNITLPGLTTFNCGDTNTYLITPDACYQIDSVVVDGSNQGAIASYSFTNITGNHTIDAYFSIITYTVTATAGSNGTITPSGIVIVNCGSSPNFLIVPDFGYIIIDVLVDGNSVGAVASYTFSNVSADHTISASFAACTNPASANAGSNASVCAGSDYTLGGSIGGAASSATWSSSGTGTFNPSNVFGVATGYTPSLADITAGSVTITLTTDDPDLAGPCQPAVSSLILTINANPVVSISGQLEICPSGSTTLTANATAGSGTITDYQWVLNGSTNLGNATTQSASTIGNYSVTVTNSNGCTSSTSVLTLQVDSPVVSISGTSPICTGTSTLLTANASVTNGTISGYQWSLNGTSIPLANASTYSASVAGSYTVVATSVFGCTGVSSPFALANETGPLSGLYTLNGTLPASCTNYVSFASAISDLNSRGISGNVTFDVASGHTETAPSGGLILNQCGLSPSLQSGATQTITFQKSGAGANPIITAQVGVGAADAIFVLKGMDYVTIDGIDLQHNTANTTATTRTESGYLLTACDGVNGAQNNTIKNCTVTLLKSNTNVSVGIAILNLGITVTATSGANSNNKFISNNVTNSFYGIYLNGYNDPTFPFAFYDQGNEVGQTGLGNSVTNFGGGNVTTAYGILTEYQNNIKVISNTVNSTGGTNQIAGMNGIRTSIASNANTDVIGNTVTLVAGASATGQNIAIINTSGSRLGRPTSTGVQNVVNMKDNIVQNCVYPSTGTNDLWLMYSSRAGADTMSAYNLNITGNQFLNNTNSSSSAAGTMYGIISQSLVDSASISNNTFTNNTVNGATGYGMRLIVTGYGGYSAGTVPYVYKLNVSGNTMSGNVSTSTTGANDNIAVETYTGSSALAGSALTVNNNNIGNTTLTSVSTAAYNCISASATVSTNSTVDLSGNTVSNITRNAATTGAFSGVVSLGTATVGVKMNGNTVSGISMTGTTTGSFTGVRTASTSAASLSMSNNSVYNVTISGATTGTCSAIVNVGSTTNTLTHNMSNNTVHDIIHAGTGTMICLDAGNGKDMTVSSNTILNNTKSAGATGILTCLTVTGSTTLTDSLRILNNTVSGNISTAGTSTMTCFTYGSAVAYRISGNQILNNTKNTTTTGILSCLTGTGSSTTTTSLLMTNNTVSGNVQQGTSAPVIFNGGSAVLLNMLNNTVSNNQTTGASGTLTCMTFTTAPTAIVSNNTILNNGSSATSGATLTTINGILAGSSATGETITNNTVRKLYILGSGTATTNVILGLRGGSNATSTRQVSGNVIDSLYSATAVTALVTGIGGGTAGNISNIFRNKVFDLYPGGSSGTAKGIAVTAGTTANVYNNIIGLNYPGTSLFATGSNAINGIDVSAGTNANLYFNTIRLAGSSTGGATFGSSGINSNTTTVLEMKNNLVVNAMTPGGTSPGFTVAYRRGSVTLTSFTAGSNNDLLYAGAPSATSLIYFDGTNSDQLISDYKTRVSTRETNAVTENVNFISTTGANAFFLHIDSTIATLVESGGVAVSGITDDYDGDLRAVIPDIGADEANLLSTALSLSNVVKTPANNQCTAQPRTVTAVATPNGSAITYVRLFWSLNGGPLDSLDMTNTSGNNYSGVIPAAFPSSAVVTWFVRAADSSFTKTVTGASYQDDYLASYTLNSSASPSVLCEGATTSLTGIVGAPGTTTIGTNTSTYSTTGNPLRAGAGVNWQIRSQLLVRASELLAAGLAPGNITSLGLITNSVGGTMGNLSIKISNTAATDIATTTYATAPMTLVYGPSGNFNLLVGLNTFTFSTPFNWNGTSNILVEICETNIVTGTSVVQVSTPGFNANLHAASLTGCSDLTGTIFPNRPLMVFGGIIGPAGFTYTWTGDPTGHGLNSTTGSNVTATPTGSGVFNYIVSATDINGCFLIDTASVTVYPYPAAPVTHDSSQCGTGIPNCYAISNGGSLRWYNDSLGGTIIQDSSSPTLTSHIISVTDTFWVSEYDGNCESQRVRVIEVVNQPDVVTAIAQPNFGCPGTPIGLSVTQTGNTNNYSYTWSASPTSGSGMSGTLSGQSISVTPTAGGTFIYTVIAYDSAGSCTTLDTAVVTITNPPVTPAPTASPNIICPGDSVNLDAGAFTSGSGLLATGNAAGNGSGAVFFDVENISTHPVTIHYFSVLTSGTTATGYYMAGGLVSCTTPLPVIANFTQVGGTVTITPLGSAAGSPFTLVPIDFNITIPVGQKYAFCIGTSGTLSYTNGTGTNCPVIVSNSDISIHEGFGGTLTGAIAARRLNGNVSYSYLVGDPNLVYSWAPPATLSNPNISTPHAGPQTTTNYTVTISNQSGCTNSASVNVVVNPQPSSPVAFDSIQCGIGIPTCFVSSSGGTIRWYLNSSGGLPLPGETGTSLTSYSISSTTTFYVSEYDGTCESVRVPITQTVTQPDTVTATVSPTSICPGNSVTLTATQTGVTNTYSYIWTVNPNDPSSGISSSDTGSIVSITPTEAGTYNYFVTATDSVAGCVTTSSVSLTVTDPPSIGSITASPNPICAGSSVKLIVSAAGSSGGTDTVRIGTGTTSFTGAVNPYYRNSYEGYKTQFLVKASALTALGFQPGNITAISFIIVTNGSPAVSNYSNGLTFSMANTTATDLSSWITTGLQTVWGPTNYSPVLGVNNHVFTTPFNWDGTSNIVIQACRDNDPNNTCATGCTGNNPAIMYTSGVGYAATRYFGVDNTSQAFRNICDTTAVLGTQTNLPNIGFTHQSSGRSDSLVWTWNPGSFSNDTVLVNPTTTTIYTVTALDTITGCSASQNITVTVYPIPSGPTTTNSIQCGAGIPGASATGSGGNLNWYLTPGVGSLFNESFESSIFSNFTLSNDTTFPISAAQNSTYYQSGTKSVLLTHGNYNRGNFSMSTGVNLTGSIAPKLSFYHIAALEDANTVYDIGTVEYSTDGGTTWNPFPVSAYQGSGTLVVSAIAGGYQVPAINFSSRSYPDWISTFTTAASTPGTGPATSLWKHETIDLSAYTSSTNFKARFRLYTDPNTIYYGWLIDNVSIFDGDVNPIQSSLSSTLTSHSISSTTTFYVAESNGTCEGPRSSVIATVNPGDSLSVTANDVTLCLGESATLVVTQTGSINNYQFSWASIPSSGSGLAGSQTNDTVIVTPTSPGTFVYTVTGYDSAAGCNSTANVSIIAGAIPSTALISATPSSICAGDSSQLNAGTFIGGNGTLATTNAVTNNSSSIVGFDIQNTSAQPITLHYFTVGMSVAAGTVATESIYYLPGGINCVQPALVPTTGWILIGSASTTSAGLGSAGARSLVPLDVNITIPAGQRYAFAIGGASIAYITGTSGCPVAGSDANLTVYEGFGGAIAPGAIIANRRWTGTVTYSYLVGNPNLVYSWTPPATLSNASIQSPMAGPTSNTTYTVAVTDPATGCASSGTVQVTINSSVSTPSVSVSPISLCAVSTATLTISNFVLGLHYQWQQSTTGAPGTWTDISGAITSPYTTASISSTVFYRAYVTCSGSADTSVSVSVIFSIPTITNVTGGTRCGAGPVTLSVTGTGTFNWFLASSGGTSQFTGAVYTPLLIASTTYWVEASAGTCLYSGGRQPVSAVINPAPTVQVAVSPGTSICSGTSVQFTATSSNDPNYTYYWTTNLVDTNGIGSSFIVTPDSSKTYYLYAVDSSSGTTPPRGCAYLVATNISVGQTPLLPVVVPSNDTICNVGDSVTLTVTNPSSGNTTYTWNPGGSTGTSVTVAPTTSTWYHVTATNYSISGTNVGLTAVVTSSGGGASALGYGPELLNDNNIPACDITGTFTWGWVTSAITNGTGSYTYTWNTPQTFDKVIFYKANRPFTLISTIEYSNNGGASFTPIITNYSSPGISCTAGTIYSLVDSVSFPAVTGTILRFSGITGSSNPNFREIQVMSASVAGGCTSEDSILITVSPITPPTITPSGPTTFCSSGSVTLDAGSGYVNYSWSDGSNIVGGGQTFIASPVVTTTYTVTVDNGSSCTASASTTVTIAPLPPPTITTVNNDPTTFCQGDSAVLDAGSGYSLYSWSDGSGIVGAGQKYTATASGTYTVTVTAANGCTSSNSIVITVNPLPPPAVITPGGPVNLCDDGSNSPVSLIADTTGTGSAGIISWNDNIFGTTGNQYDVYYNDPNITGNTYDFYVTVINANGCSNTSNSVTVNIVPCVVNVTLTDTMCIEGYYLPNTGGLMNACLYNNSIGTYTATDADSVFISAMDPITYAEVDKQIGILQTDGIVSVTFGPAVVAGNSYYIRVQHRNSIETWSADPVLMNTVASYDFTSGNGQAYGIVANGIDGMIDIGAFWGETSRWAFFSGDISDGGNGLGGIVGLQDGIIESTDYGDMENAVNNIAIGYVQADITGDGVAESTDYSIMENNVNAIRFTQHP